MAAADLNTIICAYRLVERVYSGSKTVVYRAVPKAPSSGEPCVVIKLLQQEYPTLNDLLQFRNQYIITKNLDISGIVRPYCLEPYRNSYALIMEFGGVSLREYLQDKPLSLLEVLTIALQLTDILHGIHQNRIIHKDIKPANILIDPESKQIKLIDFSIASLLPKETQEIKNPNCLEGTLAYMAPEQTGRMNRGIDYRADFYALGVTLFELLTGRLPFQSYDPIELVHCHIAQYPPSVHSLNQNISLVVSSIISKLMAKNAEDRYQSALGLKHDLQTCLEQLKYSGKIKDFVIGTRDVCDRFLIPEKLYGREPEVQMLLETFDRVANGASELILVAGFSGIGKTAVVNEVHKPIVQKRGYYIKGKFDQFNRNIPLNAFVQAFRDLIGQLLSESDNQLQIWRTQILEVLGDNAQVLIEVIPELERIIGQQPPILELSGAAAQNRFYLQFQKFLQVFATAEHPLVIFLDDLQWADSASLRLMQLLIEKSQTNYLLLIGAYRDSEVLSAHPLILTLDEMAASGARINTITLLPLSETSLNELVADTLCCSKELTAPLTELVYQKTKGNPFFATQFLKALHQDKLITFNTEVGQWQCDITQVRSKALTDDVVEFMAAQLEKLPSETQAVLKLAACIGNQFDLSTLAITSLASDTETAGKLWKALQLGLILPQSEVYKFYQDTSLLAQPVRTNVFYKFLHDRVQQAAYTLIPQDQKQTTHLKIGRLLLENTAVEELEASIFEIVNHWNEGINLIIDETDKIELTHLNYIAAQKARTAVAYEAALRYVKIAISLFPSAIWHHYSQALKLYNLGAEIAYLCGDFSLMEQWLNVVFEQAKNVVDKCNAYQIKIQAYTAQTQQQEVIKLALKVLNDLGIEFPVQPSHIEIEHAFTLTQGKLNNQAIEVLVKLPEMSEPKWLAVIQILQAAIPTIYQVNPELFQFMVFKLVDLSLEYGNASFSSFGYACYGLLLCGKENFEAGYELGKVASTLALQFSNRSIQVRTLFCVNVYINVWKKHLSSIITSLQKIYQLGLEEGEIEFTGYAAFHYSYCSYISGTSLNSLKQKIIDYIVVLQKLNQESVVNWTQCYLESVNVLAEADYQVSDYKSRFSKILDDLHQKNDFHGLFHAYLNRLIISYLFNDIIPAQQSTVFCAEYLDTVASNIVVRIFIFYDSLTQIQYYSNALPTEQSIILEKITTNQTKMQHWAFHAPMNYQHKYDLVEAERYRVLEQPYQAMELYDRAIAGAKQNAYIQEEALANELAAKFYLNRGKEKIAFCYMQEAYYGYARWGAIAKINHLESCYPQLLYPLKQQQTHNLDSLLNVTNISHTAVYHSNSISNNSNVLDFASVIKAAQAISSTIQLDELIDTLTKIIMENSGAETCVLILRSGEEWQIQGVASINPAVSSLLRIEPLQNSTFVPVKLIQYVKHTLESVQFDNGKSKLPHIIDDYLLQHKPQSVLCTPILNQGNLIGILYLEHRTTKGVFVNERLNVLQLLTTQAAISLENALLYNTLEQKVEQRTQELHYKNQELSGAFNQLKQTQSQLIQAEKMSSLGQLVAGIAHEINNPISFIHGNLIHIGDYTQNLLELVTLYQAEFPQTSNAISNKLDEIELDFIKEDAFDILNSMSIGTKRVRDIVQSLRTFARLDEAEVKFINIHEGIDSTLMILQNRFKSVKQQYEIQLIKEYGNLPLVKCYAGQLNQAIMNILVNAIDALEEKMQNLKEFQIPKIHVCTSVINDNWIQIAIVDNGIGISKVDQPRLFDPFFTTKSVGKGTGMGLSISYQIITEKHQGKLYVHSTREQGAEFVIEIPIK